MAKAEAIAVIDALWQRDACRHRGRESSRRCGHLPSKLIRSGATSRRRRRSISSPWSGETTEMDSVLEGGFAEPVHAIADGCFRAIMDALG
jgi:hypothetical protein